MTKISSLTALTGAGVDTAADLLAIVDMSLAGAARNKKITIDEFALALQTFIDARVAAGATGLLDFKGSTDCSANPNYPAASKGDFYVVSVAGKIGGASGIDVEVGDAYFAEADNAGGTQAAVGTDWSIVQGNTTGAGAGVDVEDEGVSETVGATTLNFVGAGVTAADAGGGVVDITIPGSSGGIDVEDEGVAEATAATVLNFTGAGVTATDAGGGTVDIDIPGSADLGVLHIQDQRASGTASGNITSGAWRARALTDVVLNTIAGASHVASTVTISNASPGVISWTAHGLPAGSTVVFTTTGALPTGLTVETVYYVLAPNANDFTVSATPGGAAINTSSAGSGVHTANSSLFILPAGTYDFASPVMGHQVDAHQGRLQNLTDASTTLLGMTARSRSTSATDGTNLSPVNGRFTIAAQKTFELQQRVGTTGPVGSTSSWGTEIWADVFIKRVT